MSVAHHQQDTLPTAAAAAALRGEARPSLAMPRDYYELLKPRVMSLVVFTALVGMLVRGNRPTR